MELQAVKSRFGIIGNSALLNRALETVLRVAPTDISVLVSSESGTGKEVIPKIIHNYGHRKHKKFIAVNCGAIPEGTIDSELFGHEKGAFTGANNSRKGYFEEADGGTIFLDEVAEMPLQTQVRLLRVLETGEFIKVGSSKSQKTDVRIVAATNKDLEEEIKKGRFREDLYYRLSTVTINLSPLRKRKEDILLLFRKFAFDFSEKYNMPVITLSDEAKDLFVNFSWHGNIRQLKNVTEQISIIEQERLITKDILLKYVPRIESKNLPAVIKEGADGSDFSERDILYKVLFDMKKDLNQLKSLVLDVYNKKSVGETSPISDDNVAYLQQIKKEGQPQWISRENATMEEYNENQNVVSITNPEEFQEGLEIEESLSLEANERDLIIKALKKHRDKRKLAANDLGISERTLYRKIKEYDI
ncbi:MAG: transcriptional regulator with PAS, ATPase and Fis domain [Patiriisocius sp.]|jgi:transcriptional regulator with PAS, ATPase and Fis domain